MLYSFFLAGTLLFAILMLFIISSAFFGFLITRVPFVPTYESDVKFIIEKLKVTPKHIFYDLGSGNGKVVFLVEKLSGAKAKGFEQTLWTHLWAQIKKRMVGSKAEFVRKNFFKEDWSKADIIYGYLYPPLMKRIEEKFKAEMRPGSLAVIRDFPFPNLIPREVFYMPKNHEIYVYEL
jgi:hypothetical protein